MATKPVEADEQRKARLIKEARSLGVEINVRDDADAIEKAIADSGKRTVSDETQQSANEDGKDAPEPFITPEEVAALHEEVAQLRSALQTAGAERDEARMEALKAANELAAVRKELQEARSTIFTLDSEKSKAESELFDLRAAVPEEVRNKPKTAEDDVEEFDLTPGAAPKKLRPDQMVTATVTKLGDNQIFNDTGGRYRRKEVLQLALSVAKGLEAKGYVEID